MLRRAVRQAFRVKLHAQQERQTMRRPRLQFQPFNHSSALTGHRSQRRGDPGDRLVMGAVHAQSQRSRYLGQ